MAPSWLSREHWDVLGVQVVPRLRPRDVQAVSQACRALRACVQTGIPAASWAATTSSSLAALLTGSSMDCYARLQRQAASHAALLAGSQPAMAASLGLLWPPPAGPGPACDVGPTPDSSGLLWASLHRDRLQVHMLEPGPRWELLLDQPSPEVSPSAEMRTAKMCWAPDSSQLALHIETLDPTVHPAAGFDGSQERVYLVHLRQQTVQLVATGEEQAMMYPPRFSWDSRHLLVAWRGDDVTLDIFACTEGVPVHVARVSHPEDLGTDQNFACLTNSVAITGPEGILLYGMQGQQLREVGWEIDDDDVQAPLLASNAAGSVLAALHLQSEQLVLCDTERWQVLSVSACPLPERAHAQFLSLVVCTDGQVLFGPLVDDARWCSCLFVPEAGPSKLLELQSPPAQHGQWLAISCRDGCVRVLHARTGAVHWEWLLATPGAEPGIEAALDSQLTVGWTPHLALVAADFDRRTRLPVDAVHVMQW